MIKRFINLIIAAALLMLPIAEINAQISNTSMLQINAPVGGSIEQIVGFYNQHANAVKLTDKVTVTNNVIRDVDLHIPFLLRPFIPRALLMSLSNKNQTITDTFVNGVGTDETSRSLNYFLPVNGRPYVSKLLPSHVQSASCIMQNNNWIVTIRLKEESFASLLETMQSLQLESMDFENMSEEEMGTFIDDILWITGYVSSMDLDFAEMMEANEADTQPQQQRPPGRINRIEGGFQNGTITAVINREGKLTSLVHSHNINVSISFLMMRIRMNRKLTCAYQFMYTLD